MRLDTALVKRGLAGSRNRAAREIQAGHVTVNGTTVTKPAHQTAETDTLELIDADPWVARSAHKLLGALADFNLADRIRGAVCLDAGASTGGFTQVLLAHGAEHVYAVDVGHDQLDPTLRADPRVTDMPGRNLRDLTPDWVGGAADIIVADVSFISLTLLIEPLLSVTAPGGTLLLMVKPQFELGRQALDKHGVVTSEADRLRAVDRVAAAVLEAGGTVRGTAASHLPGPAGNVEYFICAER